MKKTIPRLKDQDTVLLVIDVQEKLISSIQKKKEVIWNIKRLIKASQILSLNTIFSEQNPLKLGRTIEDLKITNESKLHAKMSFSCCKCNEIMHTLKKYRKRNILICGVETHICVQQTCIDLLSMGYQPHIVIDAVSSRKSIDHETAIRKLDSCGIFLTTTEAAIFEICGTANRDEFKEISMLIKEDAS